MIRPPRPARLSGLSRLVRARLGYGVGVVVAVVGVGWEWGTPWALMVGGLVTAGSFLTLADTDDTGEKVR